MQDTDLAGSFVDIGKASIYKEASIRRRRTSTSSPDRGGTTTTTATKIGSSPLKQVQANERTNEEIPLEQEQLKTNDKDYRDNYNDNDDSDANSQNEEISSSMVPKGRLSCDSFSSATVTATTSTTKKLRSRNNSNNKDSDGEDSKGNRRSSRSSKYHTGGSSSKRGERGSTLPGARWSSTEGPSNTVDEQDSSSDEEQVQYARSKSRASRRKDYKRQGQQQQQQQQQQFSTQDSDSSLLSIITYTLRTIGSIFVILFSPLHDALSKFFLLVLILAVITSVLYYYLFAPFSSAVGGYVSLLTIVPGMGIGSVFSGAAKYAYCGTIGVGFGCENSATRRGKLARKVAGGAQTSLDIFQSLANMGKPNELGLHHVEIWELAVAVKHSSELETKHTLGNSLYELGYEMRSVKDSMTQINVVGVNTFSWALREFAKLQRMVSSPNYSEADITKNLDIFFQRLDGDLLTLLQHIDAAIPEAELAADHGLRIKGDLAEEEKRLIQEQDKTPLWRTLLKQNNIKGNQLARDLILTQNSVANVQDIVRKLENARETLKHYRDTTGLFKAGLIGYHLSDMNLRPDDEILALSSIMSEFSDAVVKAKTATSKQHLPSRSSSSAPSLNGGGDNGAGNYEIGNMLSPRSHEFDRIGGSADE